MCAFETLCFIFRLLSTPMLCTTDAPILSNYVEALNWAGSVVFNAEGFWPMGDRTCHLSIRGTLPMSRVNIF
jgi:hypothetical protein